MTRRNQLLQFLESIYVPVSLIAKHAELLRIVNENDYRGIEKYDEAHVFMNALIISTKGRGKFESFQGYQITRVDVGRVGKEFADLAIFDGMTLAKPTRVSRTNIKVNLPSE